MEINYSHTQPNRTKHHWYQTWWGIFTIIVIVAVLSFLIAAAFYVKNLAEKINQEKTNQSTQEQAAINRELTEGLNPYYLGTSTPKVTIVEFADFSCPYCRQSANAIREIAALYPDTVKIIWRDYLGHDDSLDLALIARCAGEQNKFWEMHDGLFDNQGATTAAVITEIAEQNDLDMKKFSQCITDRKYINLIAKDESDATRLGVKGTPTWFINGSYQLEGSLSLENLQQIIQELTK